MTAQEPQRSTSPADAAPAEAAPADAAPGQAAQAEAAPGQAAPAEVASDRGTASGPARDRHRTAPLFYVSAAALEASIGAAPESDTPWRDLSGPAIRLAGPEGRHAAAARRLAVGEAIRVGDGAGRVAMCTVTAVDRAGLTCRAESVLVEPRPRPRVLVVQALPKGERGEVAVSTLTEVGVDVVVPWAAARCVTRWDAERAVRGLSRWRSAATEAAKQSRRAWIPQVTDLASTEQVALRLAAAACALVLHEAAGHALAAVDVPAAGDVVIVVGPEGGITDEELGVLGGQPVRLGPSVLRTSTAGTVAAGVVLARTARWA